MIEQIVGYKIIFSNILTTISYAFSPAMNKSLQIMHIKMTLMSPLLKHIPTASLCSDLLFGLHKPWASVDEYDRVDFFSTWRNLISHLCLIQTSMSDTILSDGPYAAICSIATKCNETLVGRLNLCCHITNIRLYCHGST